MNALNLLIQNTAVIILVVAGICTLISVITEFTKEVGFLKRIPTPLQVLVLSIIVCMTAFLAYASYAGITVLWYYIAAVIFVSFVVAIICTKGWDYLFDIWRRFYRKDIFDEKGDE